MLIKFNNMYKIEKVNYLNKFCGKPDGKKQWLWIKMR